MSAHVQEHEGTSVAIHEVGWQGHHNPKFLLMVAAQSDTGHWVST